MDVFRTQREGPLAGGKGFIVLTRREVDLRLGQPGLEASRIGFDGRLQLRERSRFVAHGEVEGRLFRQGQGAR